MSAPHLPPYLGTYEDLASALLHDPFLGGGLHRRPAPGSTVELNPQPLPPGRDARGPQPEPWNAAVRYLATLVNVKELGRTLGNTPHGNQMTASAETAFASFLDDFCGTPPRRIPWPWPGPPPWVALLSAELVSVANTQTGTMRDGLMHFAGRIAEKGLIAAPQVKSASAG